jgi:predicted extracellular nuclease
MTEIVDHATLPSARYVEIYNAGDQAQSLNGWKILRYNNGSTSSSATVNITTTVTLQPGAFWIVASSNSATTGFPFAYPTFNTSVVQYNGNISSDGNDVYQLVNNTNAVHDQYGTIGENPATGTSWNFLDSFARRNTNITQPNATFTLSEWTITAGAAGTTPGVR